MENIRLFKESLDVEKALICQIVAALHLEYIDDLRDLYTNKITPSISAILSHLFDAYIHLKYGTRGEEATARGL